MNKLSDLQQKDLEGKSVIVRGDLDVSEVNINDIRLQRLIPTLNYLFENNAKVIVIGHGGRPEGKVVSELSLKPIEELLKKILSRNDFEVLENLRFDPREEANDEGYAKELASKADIFVNEAFSVSHREHASIVGIPKLLPSYAGLNLEKEIENLNKIKEEPERPLVILISGIKEDKLKMIEPLSKLADKVLVGGRLPDFLGDNTVSVRSQDGKVVIGNLTMDKEDITLNTIEKFKEEISKAKTIVLAGVLGKYEDDGHSQGTKEIFESVANSSAFKIVGGGDSLTAIQKYNLSDKFNWISVGGGAMLEFLTNKTLVGIEALLSSGQEPVNKINWSNIVRNGLGEYLKSDFLEQRIGIDEIQQITYEALTLFSDGLGKEDVVKNIRKLEKFKSLGDFTNKTINDILST